MKAVSTFLLTLFLLACSCSTVRVAVNYDDGTDFAQYKTFTFAEPDKGKAGHQHFITESILLEIKPVLEEKGFKKTAPRQADLNVHFYTLVKNQRQFIAPSYRVDRWGRIWRQRPGHVRKYKEGTLVIDIVDRGKKELIWQGVGSGVLDPHNPQVHFIQAVKEILKDFPPGTE